MRESDIHDEIALITGKCADQNAKIYALVTRAVQRLATTGLFDPLIGYLDISINNGYFVTLPHDVKTPLKININNTPSFARSRIYEFAQNSEGTVENAENGLQWADRGYSVIQSENGLPGAISCVCALSADAGKFVTVKFKDTDGVEWTETLTLATSNPTASTHEAAEILNVFNPENLQGEIYLKCGTNTLARYYKFEVEPRYRVIKLSQTGIAARIMYRKHVFKVQSGDDYIPLNCEQAVILMCRAIQKQIEGHLEEAQPYEDLAIKYLKDEQTTATENEDLAASQEVQTAINANIFTRDSIIVADIYDEACSIFGPIGREQIFDKITTAIEVLENKCTWDSKLGVVDIWKPEYKNYVPYNNGTYHGTGLFVLPRFVETVQGLVYSTAPSQTDAWLHKAMPRNQWCEFHLNGLHNRDCAPCGSWEDLGETVICNIPPVDEKRNTLPRYLTAVPDDPLDEGTPITIYGYDSNGRIIAENGSEGFTVPCRQTDNFANGDVGPVARFERIVKGKSRSFIRLYGYLDRPSSTNTETPLLLGWWYPDEVEPKYRLIRVPSYRETRLRIIYRKRDNRISSLYQPIHLRSRLALELMMRALKAQMGGDIQSAEMFEQKAVNLLDEEQATNNPHDAIGLQWDSASSPNHNYNFA